MPVKRFFTSIFTLLAAVSSGGSHSLFAEVESEPLQQVYNHLLIRDFNTATKKVQLLFEESPQDVSVQIAFLRVLALSGSVDKALHEWKSLSELSLEEGTKRSILESIAWSILTKHANQLHVHMSAIVGASLTQDARALPVLLAGLKSQNALVRSISAQFAKNYRDQAIAEQLQNQLQREKVWYVRLQLIQSIGALRLKEATELLTAIVSDEKTHLDERQAAMMAICNIEEDVSQNQIRALLSSNRVGERHLGAMFILGFNKYGFCEELIPLLKDPNPEVRVAVMNTLSLLKYHEEGLGNTLLELMNDSHAEVAITAAWSLALQGNREGKERLFECVHSSYAHIRQIAAAAIAMVGSIAESEITALLPEIADPFACMTLAKGMVCRGATSPYYVNLLAEGLRKIHYRIMSTSGINPLFSVVTLSNVRNEFGMQQYPQYVDKSTRLELINILATKRHPDAEGMLREFLTELQPGIMLNASMILIQEGSDEAFDLVSKMLSDKNDMVRLQAALILSYVGEHEKAFPILAETYPRMSRDFKIHILQAMGYIHCKKSVDFLVNIMGQPHLVLKVVAASSLIQNVYN